MTTRFRIGAMALACALSLGACGRRGLPSAQPDSPVTVVVDRIVPHPIQDQLVLDGHVVPVQQVDLVARVAGTLERVHFKDGQAVKRGQLLFTIEQAPYRAQLRLNQAKLAQARSEYARQTQLLRENATAQASVDSALSSLQQAEANVQLAQINLGYTEIRAPFDGLMSPRNVDTGSYVGATPGGTVLATITQIAPVYVDAAVGEREALQLRRTLAARGHAAQDGVGMTQATAQLQDEATPSAEGVLSFVDHQVSQASGTIDVRGRFANTDRHLVPGLYAQLSLQLGPPRTALVLPASVPLNDPQGSYVYVVGANGVAHRRDVTLLTLPGSEAVEVLEGVASGERVVSAGQDKLRDGQRVTVADATPTGATR